MGPIDRSVIKYLLHLWSSTGSHLLFRAKQSQSSLRQKVGGASVSTSSTSTYQLREVRTHNSMSEVGGGEGGPCPPPGASDDSQSCTAAPALPTPLADDSDDEDHRPKTFSKETSVEVEVPAAVTQRMVDYKCYRDNHVSTRALRSFLNQWGVL